VWIDVVATLTDRREMATCLCDDLDIEMQEAMAGVEAAKVAAEEVALVLVGCGTAPCRSLSACGTVGVLHCVSWLPRVARSFSSSRRAGARCGTGSMPC
jgi:hypothetical protein